MVPQRWIINCRNHKHYGKIWIVELTAGENYLAEAKIQRDIFQGDALSLLLFVIAIMPLNQILRKCAARYKLSKSQKKMNHLMYKDNKLFGKNKTKRTWSPNTSNEKIQTVPRNGIWRRKIHYANNEKLKTTYDGGIELPNQEKISTLKGKETYKYLGIS